MKKNYLFLLSIIISTHFSSAQPVLTAADFTDFSVASYDVPNLTGIAPGNNGTNQIWDFSTLVTTIEPKYYLATFPASEAPFYSSFPTANYCIKATFWFNSAWREIFLLSNKANSGIESLVDTSRSGLVEEYIDTPFMPLPLNYNDTYIDISQNTRNPVPVTSTNTYDAYGTLITPFGTYTNVIRLKIIDDYSTSYNWINVNPYTPLMGIDVSNISGLITDVSIYQNSIGLGMTQNTSNNKIIAYPNPATNNLNLQLPTNFIIEKIAISNLLGKTVLEETNNFTTINVENLNNGLYILQVYSNDRKLETKFIKQ